MIIEIVIIILTTLVAYFYYMHKKNHKYFDERGIKYLPGVPLFGNMMKNTFLRCHFIDEIDAVYKAFPEERYVGFIEGTSPVILIRDPELIRNITVKDFQYFTDHKMFLNEEIEPLFGGSLLMMKGHKNMQHETKRNTFVFVNTFTIPTHKGIKKGNYRDNEEIGKILEDIEREGERWHSMRSTLSPAFTSSKMRLMLPFMTEISDNIVEYLRDNLNEDIDVEDLIRRYTSDVIASAAFGLHVNSLKDKDNEFYTIGKNLFHFTVLQRIYLMIIALFPNLAKKLGITLFSEKVMNFFRGIAFDTMKQREKNNIYRPDMIQLLMEASKGTLKDDRDPNDYSTANDKSKQKAGKEWTVEELAAQVFIFFAAGYESSATALVMCIHELALNPHVQEKLYQEIRKYKEEHGKFSFETISNLKYLDCVLNETSRKWAAAIILDRLCTEAYELPPPREGLKPVHLQPGDVVYNMVNCIHMDPLHHPNPHMFDPERFSEENKHKIKPFTYTPFGMGPRNCIGLRFALLELKVLTFHLMLNFKIVKCRKTMDPIILKPHEFNIQPKDGSFVRLEARI